MMNSAGCVHSVSLPPAPMTPIAPHLTVLDDMLDEIVRMM
jgi:hypothetical protein